MDDISMYQEAAKTKVRNHLNRKVRGAERKRLFSLLKRNEWQKDPLLRRLMRKYYKHGKTRVSNQIVLDTDCYNAFEYNGRAWIAVMGLVAKQRIAIPLNTTHIPTGTLRLLLRAGRVEVHYAVEEEKACSVRPCGDLALGVDKGYREALIDSDGEKHGIALGEMLAKESDYRKVKHQRRNKLKAIADSKPHKRDNIEKNNLGRKKLGNRKRKHQEKVRSLVYQAVHEVVDKADTIVCEDLTFVVPGKNLGKDTNRRLSGWVKGLLAEAIQNVSRRRGSSVVLVNAAYTSQMDSRYGILKGSRNGKKFNCFDGVVLDAEQNAAQNILARRDDDEIKLFMPYHEVKSMLLRRTELFEKGLRLSNPDSSCISEQLHLFRASTESELPKVDQS
jgi:IS605 OrfB family transposase